MKQSTEDRLFVEKLRSLSVNVKGGTPKFHQSHKDVVDQYHEDDPRREIVKDKAKYKTIMHGNASDKSLNRDCEAIERYRVDKKNRTWKENKLNKIKKMKAEFKAKYGYMP